LLLRFRCARSPTQLGLDADDPEAEGEVGKVGVSIGSLADMRSCSRASR